MTPASQDPGSLSFPEPPIGRLARRLCIVARNHPLLFGYLSTLFRDRPAGSEQIELVIDRRHPESPHPTEVERRRPSEIDEELHRRGFAFVVEPGESFRPRDAARIERTVELLAGMEDRSWPFRRRRRRPVLERIWGKRANRTLALLGGIALVVALASSEFRMNDLRDSDLVGPLRTVTRALTSGSSNAIPPPAPPAATPSEALAPAAVPVAPSAPVAVAQPPAAPAPATIAAQPAPTAPASPATPSSPVRTLTAEAPAAPAPTGTRTATPAPAPDPGKVAKTTAKAAAVESHGPAGASAPASRDATTRATTPERAPRALASSGSSAPLVRPAAREPASGRSAGSPLAVATAAPTPTAGDLRIELSRKPTSATGGGVVFLVRVTDLSGQPLSDAEVSMLAGRRPGGALFETRLYPAENPGTFRSGVIHPSTLPPDLTVMAVAGTRRVETLVQR